MEWWKEEPLLISAVQCNYGEDSFQILQNHVVKRGFNTEQNLHLTAKGHMGYYCEKENGAQLDQYLKQAHKDGIREIIYYNVHCIEKDTVAQHPEWMAVDKYGNGYPAYAIYYLNCINGSWFSAFEKEIRLLCQHDIDGIFLDGPVTKGCYCTKCCEDFQRRYHKSKYEATERELMDFNIAVTTEFIRKTWAIVKSIRPDILLYLNNSALRADVTGSNTREIEPYVDMLGAEGGFNRADKGTSLWQISAMMKHLEALANGKPIVNFYIGNMGGIPYYMHTPAEIETLYAQSVANGANVWFGISGPTYLMDSPGGAAAEKFLRYLNDHKNVYAKTQSVARVALMWSQMTANYYSSTVEESDFTRHGQHQLICTTIDHRMEFMGMVNMLIRNHILFDVVDEQSIEDGTIGRYDTVILPACSIMSERIAKHLRTYTADGGTLIATSTTGFFDQNANAYETPALADVFGIEKVVEAVERPTQGSLYFRPDLNQWLSVDVSAPLLPASKNVMNVQCSTAANILAECLLPMESVYQALPTQTFPCICENRYEKGRTLYFSADFASYYEERGCVDYLRMLGNAVRGFSREILWTNAPGSVEITLRKRENHYYLHLVNLTGEMERPIKRVLPVYDVEICLNLLENIRAVHEVREQPFSYQLQDDHRLTLQLDLKKVYMVFEIIVD